VALPAVRRDSRRTALLSLLLLVGCGDFGPWSSSTPQVTDEVRWTGEPQGLTGAPFLGKPVTFEAEAWHWVGNTGQNSRLSLTGWSISLADDHGAAVAGTVLNSGFLLSFQPATPLRPGASYTVTVAGQGNYTWSFVPTWPAELDPAFLLAPVVGARDVALALPPSGGALVAGAFNFEPGALVLRFGEGGELDPAFGSAGAVRITAPVPAASGNVASASAIALGPGERILVAGVWTGTTAFGWDVFALDPSGALAASYGQGGLHGAEVSGMGSLASPTPVRLRAVPTGALIVALGSTELVRLAADGSLDASFGASGSLLPGADVVGFEPLGDGRLLVATNSLACASRVSRYDAVGALDTSFGTGGSTCVTALYRLGAFTVDSTGRALLAGQADWRFTTLVRLTTEGQLDGTFGTGGVVTLPAPGFDMWVAASGARMAVATNQRSQARDWGDRTIVTWIGETGLQERREVVPSDLVMRGFAFDAVGRLYLAAAWEPFLTFPPAELVLLRFLPVAP
jgi:uncharacterized delta-60 repeat protein